MYTIWQQEIEIYGVGSPRHTLVRPGYNMKKGQKSNNKENGSTESKEQH